MEQKELSGYGQCYRALDLLSLEKASRPFVVIGKHLETSDLVRQMKSRYETIAFFSEFTSNPRYEDVCKAVNLFNKQKCDYLVAIGGGSAIDIAKCVKIFAGMDENRDYLIQTVRQVPYRMMAIPTTAGTGSESTPFSVIYVEGEKKSVCDVRMLPETIILDGELCETLPDYQKKATWMDAFSHSMESCWSVKATDESRYYALQALRRLLENKQGYFLGEKACIQNTIEASNLAGKAIAISQTTAAHAMSYKISSLYGIAHGHAVALVLPEVWNRFWKSEERRQEQFQKYNECLLKIADVLGLDAEQVYDYLNKLIYEDLDLYKPHVASREELDILVKSVNEERLKNYPITLDKQAILEIYKKVLWDGR